MSSESEYICHIESLNGGSKLVRLSSPNLQPIQGVTQQAPSPTITQISPKYELV